MSAREMLDRSAGGGEGAGHEVDAEDPHDQQRRWPVVWNRPGVPAAMEVVSYGFRTCGFALDLAFASSSITCSPQL